MSFRSRYGRREAEDSSTGAALTVTLDCGIGGSVVEIVVTSSAAATFSVQESLDGVTFEETDTIVLAGAGSDKLAGLNAFRYVRVVCNDLNDNGIKIVAGAA